jgi:hypothetical protein
LTWLFLFSGDGDFCSVMGLDTDFGETGGLLKDFFDIAWDGELEEEFRGGEFLV